MELKKKFTGSKLQTNEDPIIWITKMERMKYRLKNQFGTTYEDDDFLMQLINGLNKQYDDLRTHLDYQMGSTWEKLTLEKLKMQLQVKYERSKESTPDEETALLIKQFKGDCRVCGKIGHKGADCWTLERNKSKRPMSCKVNNNTKNNNKDKFCTYCNIKGHEDYYCFKKRREQTGTSNTSNEILTIAVAFCVRDIKIAVDLCNSEIEAAKEYCTSNIETTNIETTVAEHPTEVAFCTKDFKSSNTNLWIADSGASHHITNSDIGLVNTRNSTHYVCIADGSPLKVSKIGDIQAKVTNNKGVTRQIILKNVSYVLSFWCNLFSLTTAIDKGMKLGNIGKTITVTRQDMTLEFDKQIKTKQGYLAALEVNRIENDHFMPSGALAVSQSRRNILIEKLHQLLGHPNKDTVIHTAKHMGIALNNREFNCKSCDLKKARQINLSETNEHKTISSHVPPIYKKRRKSYPQRINKNQSSYPTKKCNPRDHTRPFLRPPNAI